MTERSIAEIEASIRATRDRLDRTVDAIGQQAAPMQFLTKGIEMIRSDTNGPAGRLRDTIARNPLPASLIGIGVGWLLWSTIRAESNEERARRRLHDIVETETPPEAPAAPVRKGAGMLDRHPAALAGLVAAAGALVGFLLPSTRQEEAVLGEARTALRGRVAGTSKETLNRFETVARDAAASAVAAAFDTVRRELGRAPEPEAEPAAPLEPEPAELS